MSKEDRKWKVTVQFCNEIMNNEFHIIYSLFISSLSFLDILRTKYLIYSINHPGCLLNFWTLRMGTYSRQGAYLRCMGTNSRLGAYSNKYGKWPVPGWLASSIVIVLHPYPRDHGLTPGLSLNFFRLSFYSCIKLYPSLHLLCIYNFFPF